MLSDLRLPMHLPRTENKNPVSGIEGNGLFLPIERTRRKILNFASPFMQKGPLVASWQVHSILFRFQTLKILGNRIHENSSKQVRSSCADTPHFFTERMLL